MKTTKILSALLLLSCSTGWAQSAIEREPPGRWVYQFGIGVISDGNLTDYAKGTFKAADGAYGGRTYNFTMSYLVGTLDWKIGSMHLQPALEIPLTLTLVDERDTDLFADYNAAAVLRWHNWPWDSFLDTSVGIGAGISYTSRIWGMDRQRHPGEDRANLKFTLPLDITFALPQYPRHQLSIFVDHQSGGHITDEGGVDALGIGYRYGFER